MSDGAPPQGSVTRRSAPDTIHIVVMGVSGSGKTTLAKALSRQLGWPFAEGDAFHPAANVEKMAAGIPLTDADRWPWLAAIAEWTRDYAAAGQSTVVSCSALRRVYRDRLRAVEGRTFFAHLVVAPQLLAERMAHRRGHFMPPSLLPSQLATLEPLGHDEPGMVVDGSASVNDQVQQVLDAPNQFGL